MALPGVRTVLKDRFYILSRTDIAPSGPKICIIGTRSTANNTSDGNGATVADLDPYLATNEQYVISAFGDGSDLHRGYVEAVGGGATQIYLVGMPSTTVDADLIITTSGNVVDKAFAAAESILPDMIVPWGRGGSPAEYADSSPSGTVTDPHFGFYADNSASATYSLANRVANACYDITTRSHPCFAVLGVKPFVPATQYTGDLMTAANVASHVALPGLITRPNVTNDAGPYLSVVASETKPVGYQADWGYSNSAALYAGFISQLKSWSNTTGKLVFNVTGMRYNATRTQQQSLVDLGVVPMALDFSRRATWIDGQTFAESGSDYSRLTTLRIIFDAVQLVRQVAQGYIGEAATLHHRNAFETAITAGLRGMTQLGALLDSNFVVTYVAAESKAIVDMVLQPAFELRNIDISVAVTF